MWATATMVKDRVGERTGLTTAEIEEMIRQSEEFWSMLMKYRGFVDGTKTWNGEKYAALSDAVCCRAALLLIAATSMSFQTLDQAELAADINYQDFMKYIDLLEDQDYVEYLKAL